MGVVKKHSIRFTFIYYIGVILGYVNTVVLFPRLLEPDQFGLTRILLSVAIIISQFAQLGTPGMVIRYYPVLKNKVFSLGALICGAGSLIVLSIITIFQSPIKSFYTENSTLFTDYFYLLLPFGAAIVFYNLFDSYLRALYKNSVSTFLSNVVLRLIWMALIIVYSFDILSFEVFIALYACSYAVISLVSLIYIIKIDNPGLTLQFNEQDKGFINQIRSFNFFTLLAGLSSFLINKIDILMLGSLEGLEIVGLYAIAAYMGMVIRVPASSIARTAQILVSESFKNNDLKSIASLYTKSSITQMILSGGIFLLILLNYNNILYLLPEEFRDSYLIFLLLGLTQVIDSAMGINGFIMINSQYYKVETLFSFSLLILTITSNLIFIPMYGAIGAALATLGSITIYNLLRLIFIWSRFKMQPFSFKSLIGLLIGFVAFLISNQLPVMGFFIVDAIVRTAVFSILFIPLVYYTKLSLDINTMIEKLFSLLKK
ncbi:lipopolysaccharide biosynthesis protein [Fulvivirga aurantia]|uniref:lipopolysaccharide biosynthesis protein n=1 Tax=Fulvivirga aurantia TaxID=2529383 RepID=UPI0012BCE10B|nr:oligosaccharide flippase family protein [Fulvivirga aurantia]